MSVLGHLLHTGIKWAPKKPLLNYSPQQKQIKVLRRLLMTASRTAFGKHYDFTGLLKLKDPRREFQNCIPVYNYESMHDMWWHRARMDESDITWPGTVPYFGVSSGSTQAPSKYIPITHQSLHCWNRAARKIFTSLYQYDEITPALFGKQALLIGGTTHLTKEGKHYYGDCSGIMAKNRPQWMSSLYKPDQSIIEIPDWQNRIEQISRSAPDWDISFLVGNAAWVQLVLESVINLYGLDHIHQIWPNLTLLLHSGIFFEPYKESFEATLKHPLLYLNSYTATEGVFAFQDQLNDLSMQLLLNLGIYYEFIPFDSNYFDQDGNLKSNFPGNTPIEEVEIGIPYAILLSTTSGAWHYLLGDVISFTDSSRAKIKLVGRTKQNLNLTGEHLSEANILEAIQSLNRNQSLSIKFFCMVGERHGSHFGHRWFLGINHACNPGAIIHYIDDFLKASNEDYAIQRASLLRKVSVEILPSDTFYSWLANRGKLNGQSKIPTILNGDLKDQWIHFIEPSRSLFSSFSLS